MGGAPTPKWDAIGFDPQPFGELNARPQKHATLEPTGKIEGRGSKSLRSTAQIAGGHFIQTRP